MKVINYFGDEGKVYYEKLSNGLEVFVTPNNYRNNYHVELVVKYGSSIKEFIPVGEKDYIKLPLGVAHFLEHKMFDIEGDDWKIQLKYLKFPSKSENPVGYPIGTIYEIRTRYTIRI